MKEKIKLALAKLAANGKPEKNIANRRHNQKSKGARRRPRNFPELPNMLLIRDQLYN
jgi:hypothetical protein